MTDEKKEAEVELFTYVNKFGPYHVLFFSLCFIPSMIAAAQALHFSITDAVPKLRCCVPSLEGCNDTSLLQYNSSAFAAERGRHWFASNEGEYCGYCTSASGVADCVANNSRPCNSGVVFDAVPYPTSAAIEFGLFCGNDPLHALVSTMFMVGLFITGAIGGSLADKYGRRPLFLVGVVGAWVSYACLPLSPNYGIYLALAVCCGVFSYLGYLTSFVILMELCEGRARTICGIANQCFFSAAYILIGLTAMYVKNWKYIYWIVSSPTLLYIAYIWLFPESIRWMIQNGKKKQARAEILRLGKMNNLVIPKTIIDKALKDPLQADNQKDLNIPSESFFELFKHWPTARMTLILFFTWMVASMTYYGLSLNTGDLPGNVYENFMLSGVVEIPAYIIAVPLLELVGRRIPLVVFWGVGGVCCIASGLIPSTPATATGVTVLALVGKLNVAAAFAVIYNYTSELFPTTVRTTACGLCSMMSRIGAMAAPQIHLLGTVGPTWLPIVIYGAFALAAAVLDLFLPETRNKPMPETIQDAISFASASNERECAIVETVELEEATTKKF